LIEAILSGFSEFFTFQILMYTLLGVIIGLVFGLMPGIGVIPVMAVLLPLTYNMGSKVAFTLLIAVQAVGFTGGSVTAILVNIPGTAANAATLIDGFPLTKKGQGGRAVGAALCASGLGGILGGIVLALLIPVAYVIVMLFASGETALMGLLGLTFIAVLSKGSTIKGFISGFVGILLSFIGIHDVTGLLRFTFGSMYLYDGIGLIPLMVGIFAFPEIFDLIIKKGGTIAEVDRSIIRQTGWQQITAGMKDVFIYWWTFIKSSIIGIVVGIIPGAGAAVAQFVAYGYAKQSTKHPESFGEGNIEGVIAPEAANNSKEGGSMLPTLAFGIPGSIAMAILMAAFLINGIQPGPAMLSEHLDLTWFMIISLIISNILGVVILLPFISILAKVAFARGRLLIPIILLVASFGAYASKTEFLDIIASFAFGILGYAMVKAEYDRVALVLGFILGGLVERYFTIIISAKGAAFLLRPPSLILAVMIVVLLVYNPIKGHIQKRKKEQ